MALGVLALSLLLQVAAAVLALRLVRITGRPLAWMLVAAAILLMAVRRSITLGRGLMEDDAVPPDLSAEVVALAISVLMVAGLAGVGGIFRAVKAAGDEMRQLLESAPEAMVIADDADRILDVNAQAVRLFGWRRDQMVGQDVTMLMPERFRERHRARRAAFHRNPRPNVLGAAADVYGLRRDGTEFPVEVSVSPLRSARGSLVVSSIRDITERREVERAIRESEERYRSLLNDVLDSSPVAVAILDGALRVVWVNRAYEGFFGIARRDVVGQPARTVVKDRLAPLVPEDSDALDRILAAYENNTYVEAFELRVQGNGQERWLEHWSRPIETGLYRGGRIEHYTDVTERRLAEERIRLFMHICRSMQVGLLVYRMDDVDDDRSLRIVTVNPKAEALLGFPKEEILGRRIDEAFPALRARGIPALFAEVLRADDARRVEDFDYGDDRVLRQAWSFNAFPLPDRCVGVVFESITESKRREELLRNLAAGVAAETGDAFFRSLVRYLAKTLGQEYAFVGQVTDEGDRIRTLAICDHGAIADNIEYELKHTPCAEVVGRHVCVHEAGVQQRFPKDVMLKEMGVESYVGSPLFGPDNKPLGLIAVLGEEPLEDPETARAVHQIFAARAAAELSH